MWCKHTNYEHAARIPLIVALPGKTGTSSTALVETVDLYPTLAELAGLTAPEGLDGKSFAALLDDPMANHRDHAIHVYPRNDLLGRAIRTDRYRLVEWKKPGAAADTAVFELYDYESDPDETKNLAPEQSAVVAELKGFLAAHPEAVPQIRAKAAAETPSAKSGGKPKGSPKDRSAMFRQRDKDQDGRLTREEFLLNQPDPDEAPKRFPVFDADGDGFLSEVEFVKSGKVGKP
jgi:iduronate 2-sulfatase